MGADELHDLLTKARQLAADYYRLTGKPLGITGEIAEQLAAERMGLTLAPPRTQGYDATRIEGGKEVRIQIKGRAFAPTASRSQRMGRIRTGAPCDIVMLVIMDNATLDAREIWEARVEDVERRLAHPGSKARARGSLSIGEFCRLATRVWPAPSPDTSAPPSARAKTCPECGHSFAGSGWGGLDSHWRAHHAEIMPYEQARSLIKSGSYPT